MNKIMFNIEENIGYLIARTFKIYRFAIQKLIDQEGLNISVDEYAILLWLLHKDGQMQIYLARIASKDKTSITRIVDDLEKKNYVTRVPNKSDRRQKDIFLTDAGRKFVEDTWKFIEMKNKEILKDVSNKDLETLKNVLKKITSNMIQNKNLCPEYTFHKT